MTNCIKTLLYFPPPSYIYMKGAGNKLAYRIKMWFRESYIRNGRADLVAQRLKFPIEINHIQEKFEDKAIEY